MKGVVMTTLATKTLCALLIAGSFAVSSSASAGNSFNKYTAPVTATQTHTFQATAFEPVTSNPVRVIVTHKGIKRVVQPLPNTQKTDLSFATDNGTKSLKKGFNKMKKRSVSRARPMRTYIDVRAQTAR